MLKKEEIFLRKFRLDRLQKVIYEEGLPNILYEEMRKYLTLYEEAIRHI